MRQLSEWWQQLLEGLRQIPRWAVIALILIFVAIWADLNYNWTGYGYVINPLTEEEQFSRHKSIWDWMELLIIPAALAIAAIYLNQAERKTEREVADKRLEEERRIAAERAEDIALETYLAQMSDLLINHKLREAAEDNEKRTVARAWTLTIARRLGRERKNILLRFLREAKMIDRDYSIVPLNDIDLSGAYLSFANLSGADLSNARLSCADLGGANLSGAKLSGAILSNAELSDAKLNNTFLNNAHLNSANLINATLCDAYLRDAYLRDANLSFANLSGADLITASLRNTKLIGANLSGAYMMGADLSDADLRTAILSGADLRGAILLGTNLSETNLKDADLEKVLHNENTKWPDGKVPSSVQYPQHTDDQNTDHQSNQQPAKE